MNTTIKTYFTLYEPFIGEKTIYLAPKKIIKSSSGIERAKILF